MLIGDMVRLYGLRRTNCLSTAWMVGLGRCMQEEWRSLGGTWINFRLMGEFDDLQFGHC
jgi:hypothetical protein